MLTEAGVCGVPVLALVAHLPCKKNGILAGLQPSFVLNRGGRVPRGSFRWPQLHSTINPILLCPIILCTPM